MKRDKSVRIKFYKKQGSTAVIFYSVGKARGANVHRNLGSVTEVIVGQFRLS